MPYKIPTTPNLKKLAKADSEGYYYKVLEGSSGSGKTFAVIQYLIQKALSSRVRITAFRQDQATCRDSIVSDFKRIMIEQFRLWERIKWNNVTMTCKFPNGSEFQFRGANSPAKLHGPRREIAWLNETIEISYAAFRQIVIRTAKETILDFNPSVSRHWVFDKVLPREDAMYIHSTFRDNPHLPAAARNEILALEPNEKNRKAGTADEFLWEVYGLGKRGRREGAIFKLFEKDSFFPDPHLCTKHGYGLDFGFAMDPTALIECAVWNGKLYVRQRLYEKALIATENTDETRVDSIEGRLKELGITRKDRIYADSSRPEIIAALRAVGLNVKPARKGRDSIVAGIDRLKSLPLFVHEDSDDIIVELENYTWQQDRGGTFHSKPIDKYNHAIDAMRYWAIMELQASRMSSHGRKTRKAKSSLRIWR